MTSPERPVRMTIPERIQELVMQHGGFRAAGRATKLDSAYLLRLAAGEKKNPSATTLRRLGLRQIVTYERITP